MSVTMLGKKLSVTLKLLSKRQSFLKIIIIKIKKEMLMRNDFIVAQSLAIAGTNFPLINVPQHCM